MELLKELYDSDAGITANVGRTSRYKIRRAARAVLFNVNDNNEIALLFVSKDNYHKLPGGGIEANETILNALNREILEETGCKAGIIDDIGVVLEFRNKFEQLQISYCYLAKTIKIINKPSFTEKELSQGFELKWFKIKNAIDILENDKPTTYEGKFIQKRDLIILSNIKHKT